MNTISQKFRRRSSVAFHLARFLAVNPTPCGCTPKIPPCDCQDFCRCELDLDFCECSGDWPVEFLDKVGDWLAFMDPLAYANRPHPATTEMYWIAWEVRLETLASRFESGYSLWHEEDRQRDAMKNGEKVSRAANGAVILHGTGAWEKKPKIAG